jgi:hypothetical protein
MVARLTLMPMIFILNSMLAGAVGREPRTLVHGGCSTMIDLGSTPFTVRR